jgi:hypothetical protein
MMGNFSKPRYIPLICLITITTMPTRVLADEILFAFSDASNSLTLSILGGPDVILSTADSEFDIGVFNQGWWSWDETRRSNTDDNDNYAAGGITNNFFTFDISDISSPVTSAVFNVTRAVGVSDSGYTYFEYNMFDVITDAETLNSNNGVSQVIYDDLGSGVHYGSFDITVAGDPTEILMLQLNEAFISDINTAILGTDQYFSIGGQRSIVPIPAAVWLFGSGLIGLIGVARRKAHV